MCVRLTLNKCFELLTCPPLFFCILALKRVRAKNLGKFHEKGKRVVAIRKKRQKVNGTRDIFNSEVLLPANPRPFLVIHHLAFREL